MTYYNEHDLKAAAWLDMLSTCGEITAGDVDPRDIQKVRADDLEEYDRCHFFAGIGGWDLALQLAGWPAGEPVWTASLPCQPFSGAGKQKGTDDDRHLWPVFRELVEQCRPAVILGEQVASKLGRAWLASVQADLEALGYITAGADLCAAGVGAPHIRQRLYWCAVRREGELPGTGSAGVPEVAEGRFGVGGLEHPDVQGRERPADRASAGSCEGTGGTGRAGCDSGVAVSNGGNPGAEWEQRSGEQRLQPTLCGDGGAAGGLPDTERQRTGGKPQNKTGSTDQRPGTVGELPPATRESGYWDDVIYLPCADGKARPIKPGIEPLVDGLPPNMVRGRDNRAPFDAENSAEGRVMRLRGYGNAINTGVAVVFIRSVLDALQDNFPH